MNVINEPVIPQTQSSTEVERQEKGRGRKQMTVIASLTRLLLSVPKKELEMVSLLKREVKSAFNDLQSAGLHLHSAVQSGAGAGRLTQAQLQTNSLYYCTLTL